VIYLAHIGEHALGPDEAGPWADLFVLAPGLVLVDSEHTRSEVYHGLKHALPEGSALLVAPLAEAPKFKGMASGAGSWLRARLPT
jgi:hypothetical protein